VAAARELDEPAIAQEFDALFGGIGKPDILPYASSHLSGFLNERPLAQLREDLQELGLTRDDAMAETEDHLSYLCEVMRYLIAGDDVAVANLTRQREFFARHLQPWLDTLCEDILAHPRARFYAAVAGFTQAFASVEQQGFDLLA
jgi:TorA maturation chaperone TorD